jgi:Ser/Thr protein kinase RdoA (MazF antagonist)
MTVTLKEIEEHRKEILQKNNVSHEEKTFLKESTRLIPILNGFHDAADSSVRLFPLHRDLIAENLIWKQGKLAGVFDFEHVSETNDPIVKDLAVTMQYCCRDKMAPHQLDIDCAVRFLQVYRNSLPLSDQEVLLIPDLITAGFVEDFAFAFWMIRNDPERAKQSEGEGYGLTLYSKAAQWSNSNKDRIFQALLN